MIRTYRRAADEGDLKALTRDTGSFWRNVLAVALPIAAILFGGVYFIFRSWVAAGVVAAAFFVPSLISNLSFRREVARRDAARVNANAVEVYEVAASRVLEIEHLGSHGPAYCFFVGDGRALLLIGQWLLEPRSFPADAFRLHRWADTGEPIRIEVTGTQVAPEMSTARVPSTGRVRDIEQLHATPETLQADLNQAFGA